MVRLRIGPSGRGEMDHITFQMVLMVATGFSPLTTMELVLDLGFTWEGHL